MGSKKKSNIDKLRDEIRRHDELYYKKAQPEISDYEYDQLKKELESLETTQGEFDLSASPTQAVGDDRIEGFQTYKHNSPMYSIDNSYNQEELFEFDTRLKKLFGQAKQKYTIEPKIDGVAVSLTYEDGEFVRGVTRGNGVEGDDITHNVKTIKNLPKKLEGTGHPKSVELRGEIYLSKSEFERINEERDSRGEPTYANPRNLAAGTVKLLDPKEAAARKLEVILYGIGQTEGTGIHSQVELQKVMKSWGLPVQGKIWISEGIEGAWKAIEELDTVRKNFSYGTDGAVVKLDDFAKQKQAGYTAKSPRWMIAYKFAPEQAQTKLKGITIQVGRTGVLTPVGELEPVFLDGSTVSRVTLHNEDEIKRKDVRVDDTVVIEKAGDIIPAVVKVLTEKRSEKSTEFQFPKKCPACSTEVVRLQGEVAWRCPNASCPPQVRRRIQHFASRQAMDIEHLGIAVTDQLVSESLCQNYADIYTLKEAELIPLEKFGEKAAKNLIKAIEASKKQQLWRLIHGLGIPNIGAQTAKDLARSFGSLDKLMAASEAELIAIDGIGETIAESILTFFKERHNQELVKRLESYGLNLKDEKSGTGEQKLAGKIFVLTGTLPTLSRDEAKELIEGAGGRTSSSVSKKTDYLLSGESVGSKFDKAKSLGVPIISEEDFRKLL